MYEPPSEQGDDTGYDVTNKGSRLAGTIGMHRPRHNDRLTDHARPRTSIHLWRSTFSETKHISGATTCLFGGVGKIYRTQGFFLPIIRHVGKFKI